MTNFPRPPQPSYLPILGEIEMDVLVQLPGNEPIKVGRIGVPIYARGHGEFNINVHEQVNAVEKAAREAMREFPPIVVPDSDPAEPQLAPVMTAAEIVEMEPRA